MCHQTLRLAQVPWSFKSCLGCLLLEHWLVIFVFGVICLENELQQRVPKMGTDCPGSATSHSAVLAGHPSQIYSLTWFFKCPKTRQNLAWRVGPAVEFGRLLNLARAEYTTGTAVDATPKCGVCTSSEQTSIGVVVCTLSFCVLSKRILAEGMCACFV